MCVSDLVDLHVVREEGGVVFTLNSLLHQVVERLWIIQGGSNFVVPGNAGSREPCAMTARHGETAEVFWAICRVMQLVV